ncbi:MAG: cystathionine beta-synthase [Candidatus Thermoplasmatota archaeon]|nr:cystathionine beta-synthase [Candidatus Thermoplasmatota archaeon]
MRYYPNILEAVGRTPLIRLNKVADGFRPLILAKLESFNPGGSVKDRIGLAMIEDAEGKGLLRPGWTIIEPTSGNTGIGLAMVAAIKGYRCIFTIPDKMSQEKIDLLKAFGTRVVLCPTAVHPDSPQSYYKVAERLQRETPNSFIPQQYFNPMNPEAHYQTTGPEIWEATDGKVTHFVCGMGTGGTISGAGKYLKERNPDLVVVGVDPVGSVLADYFRSGEMVTPHTYKVEGIGEDIIPGTTQFEYIDEIVKVDDRESFLFARRLAREEGILVGGSSGSALAGALRIAKDLSEEDVVVVLLADTGERYLGKVHNEEWLREHGFLEEGPPLADILTAKDPRLPMVVTVEADERVMRAVELMGDYTISQLPVLESGKLVGSIREEALLAKLVKRPDLTDAKIKGVMEEPFPTVDSREDLEKVCKLLLRGTPAVIVTSGDEFQGIVTRFDVVEYLARRPSS